LSRAHWVNRHGSLSFASRANLDSDHDSFPRRRRCGYPGEKAERASLSGRPTASFRATPRHRLLHHATPRKANPIEPGYPSERRQTFPLLQ
jgi:hypothetical protein